MMALSSLIDSAFDQRMTLTPESTPPEVKQAVMQVIDLLDNGTLRVAEKIHGQWHTHPWIKKAVRHEAA